MFIKIKDFIKEYYDIFFLLGLILLSEMLMRYFSGLPLFYAQAFIFNIINYIFIAAILIMFKTKTRIIIEIIITIIFAIYSFAQSLHYAFFTSFYSFRKLTVVNELFNVKDEVVSKLEFKYLLFLIPIILIIILYKYKKSRNLISKRYRIIFMIILIIIATSSRLFIINNLRNDYKIDKSWYKDYYLHEVMQNRYKYMNRFGVIEYNIKDIELTFKPSKTKLNDDEIKMLDNFTQRYNNREINEMSAKFKDKNLVLVLCESFDESAIKEDLTPTLYKLKNEGIYFNNHYAPIFQVATGDSEFISQTGMLPSVDYGTTSYTFNLNSYPYALANLFKNEGYEVNSYHSYTSNFYNRESIHESFGFSTFYDMDKLGLKRWKGYKETLNWIKDEDLFNKVIENTNTNNKFFDFVVSVSGHMPYSKNRIELKENYEYINNIEEYQTLDEESKYYLAAQMLLDQGIKALIDNLENKDVLDDTVIWLFADHYPYGIKTDEAKKNILNDESGYEMYKVPMMIYAKDLKPMIVDEITSTFDIYPSISNSFDLKANAAYKVGRDIFSKDDEMVIFDDRSFLANGFYYDSNEDILYDTNNNIDKKENDTFKRLSKKVNDIFYYGQQILLSDYYGLKEDE